MTSKKLFIKTPNGLNSEIERLRRQLSTSDLINADSFAEMQNKFWTSGKREKNEEDLRCVDQFMNWKGNGKSGKFVMEHLTGMSLPWVQRRSLKKAVQSTPTSVKQDNTPNDLNNDESKLMDKRDTLFDQEAILSELADTLSKQNNYQTRFALKCGNKIDYLDG